MGSRLAIFMLAFLLLSFHIKGQNFPIGHLGVDDGLPSNRIYDIYRDSKGYLWIATDKGVGRYNGLKIEKFNTFNGLSDNEVFFFKEDFYGRIWMATYNGELCYYKDGVFHNAYNTPFLKLPPNTYYNIPVFFVQKDSSVIVHFSTRGTFAVIGTDKIELHNIVNERNDHIEGQGKKMHGIISTLYSAIYNIEKIKGGFKLSFKDSVAYLNNRDEVTAMQHSTKEKVANGLNFSQNKSYYYDSSGVYDTGMNLLFKYRPEFFLNNRLNLYPLKRVYVNDKYFFMAVDSGLYIGDTCLLLRKDDISSMTQDIEGNYWIGTLDNGIIYMPSDFDKNHLVKNAYKIPVRYCTVKDGHLFFVTADNNLYWIDEGRPVCLYDHSKHVNKAYKYPYEPGYVINDNYDFYFFYNADHTIIKNILGKKLIQTKYPAKNMQDAIKSVFLSGNNIFVYDMFRAVKIDYSKISPGTDISDKVKIYKEAPNEKEAWARIFGSAQAEDHSVWYSTIRSMYKIAGDTAIEQKQLSRLHFKKFMFCGTYLIGYTQHNMLMVCNKNSSADSFTIDSVTTQNCIWNKMYKIDSAHVLLSTDDKYRLLTLYPVEGKPRFNIVPLENRFLPLLAEAICADGSNLYFFKNGDITSIDVKTLYANVKAPTLYFTTLKMGQKSIPVDNEYTVPFDQSHRLALSYSTVSFGGKDVSYQYSLSKGNKDNWYNIEGGEINLANANYGDYTIKVRAKTLSSNYSTPIVFNLHILKPFWATWWFISLSVLALIGVTVLIVMQRIRVVVNNREKEHDNKVRFMRSEYKALNALMNPHFIFNTLNNVQSLVNGNNKLAANEYLRIFADLVRQNMHNVSKELIPLQKEVDLVRNYLLLEKLRFEDKLNYSIDVDPGLELYDIMVSPLLIQPLVENSIKHGILPLKDRAGFIKINIYDKDNLLYIEISDNGVGLNNAAAQPGSLHESYGLSNIKKRIEQLSVIQDKVITFNIGEENDMSGVRWTMVTITMPL